MTLGEKVAEVEALRAHGSNQYSESGDSHTKVHYGANTRYLTSRLKREALRYHNGWATWEGVDINTHELCVTRYPQPTVAYRLCAARVAEKVTSCEVTVQQCA